MTPVRLLFMNHLHEDFFQGARRTGQGLYLALCATQQIDSVIGLLASGEEKLNVPVAMRETAGLGAQRVLKPFWNASGFHAVTAACSEILDLAF